MKECYILTKILDRNNKYLNKLTKIDQDDKTDQKLDEKDVPIVTYCAHSECDASKKLLSYSAV